jgi:hypothetical protein
MVMEGRGPLARLARRALTPRILVAIVVFGPGAVACSADGPQPGDRRVLSAGPTHPVEGGCFDGLGTGNLWLQADHVEVTSEEWACIDGKGNERGGWCGPPCEKYGWSRGTGSAPSKAVSATCTTAGCSARVVSDALVEVTVTQPGDTWLDIVVAVSDYAPPVTLRGHLWVSANACADAPYLLHPDAGGYDAASD